MKKRITNIEQGIMNVEVRYSIDLYLSEIARAQRFHTSSFEISCSIFCGSLFQLCVVSYERRLWPRASSQIEIETLVWRCRRVGHRADQFRRARWPALRSQTFEVSYEMSGVSIKDSEISRNAVVSKHGLMKMGRQRSRA
jgi:hypothetical protein